MAETSSRGRPQPSSARLLASVPPLVKITLRGAAPASPATSRRAPSIMARARRPSAWTEEALPMSAIASSAASRALGRNGAVALWSR